MKNTRYGNYLVYFTSIIPQISYFKICNEIPLHLLLEGDPFQGLGVSSCLTLRNELSEETHILKIQKNFIGKGCSGREWECKGTQKNCSATWLTVSGFMGMGLAFQVVSGQSSCLCPYLVCLRILPGGTHIYQPRWIPV